MSKTNSVSTINQNPNDLIDHEAGNPNNISKLNEDINDVNLLESSSDTSPDMNNNKSLIGILFQRHKQLESHEAKFQTPTIPFITNNLPPKLLNNNSATRGKLSSDVYTIMMLSHWSQKSFRHPCNYCKMNQTNIIIPRPSISWMLGMAVFITQTLLASMVFLDQITSDFGDTPLDIPIRVTVVVRTGQFLTLILAIMSQSDLLVAFRVVSFLNYKNDEWLALTRHDENKRNLTVWLGRILLPNLMKSIQGLLVLVTTFIVIVQSDNIVELLIDFTVLLVISSIDDMFFFIADHGFLGKQLLKNTNEAKEASIKEDDRIIQCFLRVFSLSLVAAMFGGWIVVFALQRKGVFISQKYPNCPKNVDFAFIGNGICDVSRGVEANILECGEEGGDCMTFNQRYPNCIVDNPSAVGDGDCNVGPYNTAECGWDGGDCIVPQYPECRVSSLSKVGDGMCHGDPYNTAECGWDDGDCVEFNEKYPNCTVDNPYWIGDGSCDGVEYNTAECGWDGGDCIVPQYLECRVSIPSAVGNGFCDGVEYNTAECGWDGGDCIVPQYPECRVSIPSAIGNGLCDGVEYNTAECEWDGGDCIVPQYPECRVSSPSAVGNGRCDIGPYNTAECGWDGGDCVEFNEKYPNCKVNIPSQVGDGRCDIGPYNTAECEWDGGDCVEFNKNISSAH